MTGLDVFTWFVLIVMGVTILIGFVVLAQLPGKMAAANNHPQAGAINMAGWLGLIFTAGIVWIIAMIWANTKSSIQQENTDLTGRVEDLEKQLQTLLEAQA